MAGGSNSHTSVSDLEKGYKKSVMAMQKQFARQNEEYGWFDDIPDAEITPSGRENLIPLDVTRGFSSHMVSDGGYEARTVSPALQEGTFSFVHANSRFFISVRARAFDSKAKGNQIVRQIKYQSMKCFEGLSRVFSLQTYGFTTGILADTSTNATATSGQAYTLEDAFGVAAMDNAAYLASLFAVDQRVALIRSAALVTNGLGVITAVTAATPSITVTWDGSVDADANDSLVYAEGVTDATITASDYGKWPVGLLDAIQSTSVHGLSGSTYPNWTAAGNNSDGGRFNATKLKKMRQALRNRGDANLTDVIWSNGVENDVEAGERSARVYQSSALDLDQSVKAKGVTFRTSPLVPPGCVFGIDRDALGKKVLTDKPGEGSIIDGEMLYKAEDRSGFKGGLDLIHARVIRKRAGLFLFSALDEQ